MSTTATTPAESALAAPAPVGHMPHPPNPSDGPMQLSAKHPNVVNYAISAGGVVLGIALITTFALICRWRRRRRQRALDEHIDARIREKTLSRLEANRTHSLSKLPAAALASEQSVLRPLPRLSAHSANSSEESLPRPRQACIRSSDQRLPCGCPDCVVFARSSTLAPSLSGSALATADAEGNAHGTLRHSSSHRQPRAVSAFVRGRHSPLPPPGLRVLSLGPSASRAQRRTDENVHRAASVRTPSPRVASPFDYSAALDRSASSSLVPTATYSRGTTVGMGIMVAARTSAFACPSPAPATPPLGFSTPRTGTSLAGSPAPSLSDNAGATTLNPIVSVDVAASRGHLGSSLAHMQVSPLVQDAVGSPISAEPSLSGVVPETETVKASELPFSPRADGGEEEKQWLTEADWFGPGGPLDGFEPCI
ncbi:hypothetical protein C8T65DRAFT_746947 [Cerioporus squamosus]|nr:hypothetical protein C8T65DRAFT_746947 [Cerioporus squamosus]